jgi:phosphoserine phosphatase
MNPVLTLIARPGSRALDGAALKAVSRLVPGAPRWLAEAEAVEIPLAPDVVSGNLEDSVRRALAGLPIDIAVVAGRNRRKRLLLADMDSTIIEQEVVDELAAIAGVGEAVSAITARTMLGELEFEPALAERVALLEGLPASAIDTVIRDRLTFVPGGRTVVRTMKASGAFTAIVSGGFTAFTGHVAETLGFDSHEANRLLIEDGRLTGRVAEPVLGRSAKVEVLKRLIVKLGIGIKEVIAVGDGANDIAMVRLAGLGVAFRAKPAVRAAADVRIDHADLTALLYLQGYRKSEFVT